MDHSSAADRGRACTPGITQALAAQRAPDAAARTWQALAYAAGWLPLAAALVSPLHWLGERLFTAHMVEHEIVMTIAAPLLVLARPGGVFLWAFRTNARRRASDGSRAAPRCDRSGPP